MSFDPSKLLEIGVTAIATLTAAYFGAAYAFKLNKSAEETKEIQRQVGAYNRLIFLLTKQAEVVRAIESQSLSEYRAHAGRHALILPSLEINASRYGINSEPLGFMCDEYGVQLLADAVLEDDRYEGIISAVNRRSKLCVEELQPLLRANNTFESVEALDAFIGRALSETLKRSTNDIYSLVDNYIVSNREITVRLVTEFKRRFPGYKTIAPVEATLGSSLDQTSPQPAIS